MPIATLDINLLQYADQLSLKTIESNTYAFDPCRKKFVRLEPEEFVRQLVITYLHQRQTVGYGRILVEKQMPNYQFNRFDLGVMKTNGSFSLLVECKSFKSKLTKNTLVQVAKYNQTLAAEYVMVTNGKQTCLWSTDEHATRFKSDEKLIGCF